MRYTKRLVFYPLLLLFLNVTVAYNLASGINIALKILAIALLSAAYLYYCFKPAIDAADPPKQKRLVRGYELVLASCILFAAEIAVYVYLLVFSAYNLSKTILIVNAVLCSLFLALMVLGGLIRIALRSKQLGSALRIAMFFVWWVPIANLVVLGMVCKTVHAEYHFNRDKLKLNESRSSLQVCGTKYPLLMVHGVFFRDWKHFNYWGRIPKELIDNGAQVFYGNHNSALPVEQAAEQLKQRILEVMQETGCEKVNIIGHSKGGLDARYAISCLGMDAHVASLTTVNTPHRGTPLAGKLLDLTPDKLVAAVGKKYAALFAKLGDDSCDFGASVNGLTPEQCAEYNSQMPDRAGVYYQSVGSKMSAISSAGPPLNVGYAIIKPMGGDNDGLVCVDSMAWGKFLGILSTPGKKGISHGDMIDLTRKNIPGFDVCEYYVSLISALKQQGF